MITPKEVGLLLGLAAARDQRTVGDADTMAWYDDLNNAGISYQDARAAISHFYARVMSGLEPKDRRRITTPDIIAIAKRARRERLENLRYDGDPDETPAQYLARYRARTAAVADGQIAPDTGLRALGPGAPEKRLLRAIAGVGHEVPAEPETADDRPAARRLPRLGPLSVRCPACSSPIGRKCRAGTSGHFRRPHRSRVDAARVAAGREPEPREDPAEIERRRAASVAFLADHQPEESA